MTGQELLAEGRADETCDLSARTPGDDECEIVPFNVPPACCVTCIHGRHRKVTTDPHTASQSRWRERGGEMRVKLPPAVGSVGRN